MSTKEMIYLLDSSLSSMTYLACGGRRGDLCFAVTNTNELIVKKGSEARISIKLDELLRLDRKEHCLALTILDDQAVLLITSKLRIFSFSIGKQAGEFEIQTIPFPYLKSVPKAASAQFYDIGGLVLLRLGRFIFKCNMKAGQVNILKMFNQDIKDVLFVSQESELAVTTSRELSLFSLKESADATSLVLTHKESLREVISVAVIGSKIALLSENSSIQVFEVPTRRLCTEVVLSTESGRVLELRGLRSIGQSRLLGFDASHIYILSESLERVSNVFSVKDLNYIISDGWMIDLNKRTENRIAIASLACRSYTKDLKYRQYKLLSAEERLGVAFTVLARRLLKPSEFAAFNQKVAKVVERTHLESAISKHPRFREYLLRLLALLRAFSVPSATDSGYQVDPPKVVMRSLPDFILIKDKKMNTNMTINSTESSIETPASSSSTPLPRSLAPSANSPELKSPIDQEANEEEEKKEQSSTSLCLPDKASLTIEQRIIMNNMRKCVVLSQNPSENAALKLIRAKNRVVRLSSGRRLLQRVLSKQNCDERYKLYALFFICDKFAMKKSQKILLNWVSDKMTGTAFGRASRLLATLPRK